MKSEFKSNRKTRSLAISIGDFIIKSDQARSPITEEKHCDAAEQLLAEALREAEARGMERAAKLFVPAFPGAILTVEGAAKLIRDDAAKAGAHE